MSEERPIVKWTKADRNCKECRSKNVYRKWDLVDDIYRDDGAKCEDCGAWMG